MIRITSYSDIKKEISNGYFFINLDQNCIFQGKEGAFFCMLCSHYTSALVCAVEK